MKKMKRIISLMLAVLMLTSMKPATTFAEVTAEIPVEQVITCGVCGNENCDKAHKLCESCGKWDCAVDHAAVTTVSEADSAAEPTVTTEPSSEQGEASNVESAPKATETPEATETPDASEASEVTETPEATETPDASEASEVTETPEATETPDASEASKVTETPEATETPAASEASEVTETPEATQTPTASEAPEADETPEVTETPTASEAPEAAEIPEVTEASTASEAPEATETPTASEAPEATEIPTASEAPDVNEPPEVTETPTASEAPETAACEVCGLVDCVCNGEEATETEPEAETETEPEAEDGIWAQVDEDNIQKINNIAFVDKQGSDYITLYNDSGDEMQVKTENCPDYLILVEEYRSLNDGKVLFYKADSLDDEFYRGALKNYPYLKSGDFSKIGSGSGIFATLRQSGSIILHKTAGSSDTMTVDLSDLSREYELSGYYVTLSDAHYARLSPDVNWPEEAADYNWISAFDIVNLSRTRTMPEPTAKPEADETPEATETPTASEAPEADETPDVIETPTASEAPEADEIPDVIETPTASEAPEADETPEVIETPTASEAPEAAETPDPAACEICGMVDCVCNDEMMFAAAFNSADNIWNQVDSEYGECGVIALINKNAEYITFYNNLGEENKISAASCPDYLVLVEEYYSLTEFGEIVFYKADSPDDDFYFGTLSGSPFVKPDAFSVIGVENGIYATINNTGSITLYKNAGSADTMTVDASVLAAEYELADFNAVYPFYARLTPDANWPETADGYTWIAVSDIIGMSDTRTQPEPEDPEENEEIVTLPDAGGSGVTVTAINLPEGVSLSVKEADVTSQLSAFGIPTENLVFGLDISIVDKNGADYQPEIAMVKVPVNKPVGTRIGILHTHDDKTSYLCKTEVLSDGTVEFYTDGFSEFAGFTVDFHYNGKDFSIDGMTSILLSDLFEAIGFTEKTAAEATDVVFSNPELVSVTQQEGDWLLTSLKAFDTNELLTITFNDGSELVIDVTDAYTSYLDFSNWGISAHFSSTGKSTWDPTVYLYWGDSGSSFANSTAKNVITWAWLGITSPYYWFEVKSYDRIGDGNPYMPVSGLTGYPEMNAISLGAFSVLGGCKVHLKVWDRTITDSSNSAYCSIEQAGEFVAKGDTIRRNVKIYLDGAEKQTISNVLFPHRSVGSNSGNAIAASDLTTVSPNNSAYFKRGDVGGAATVVASGDTYHVYLVTRGTIKYDANGGTGAPGSQYKYNGINLTLSSTKPTRAYATFKGWATSKARADAGTVDYASGANYTANLSSGSTTTLYAVWGDYTTANYTVKHMQENVAGTGYVEVTADRQTLSSKAYASVTPAVKIYTGFNSPATQTVTVNGDGSTVVEYRYTRKSYTVTTTAGTGISAVSGGGTYKYGASVTINATVNSGFTWVNWTGTSTVSSQQYTFTMPANNVSYTANAVSSTYNITYNLAGGSLPSGVTNPSTYRAETATFTLNNPTREGYTFGGWTGTGLSSATMTVTITKGSTGARSYTATWNPNVYKVTLDKQGGDGGTDAYWYEYNTTKTISGVTAYYYTDANCTTPVKDGYYITVPALAGHTFGGYWTGKNGTGTQYVDADGMCINNRYQVIGDVTLYAKWTPIVYTITWKNDDGSVIGTTKVAYGSTPTHADAVKAADDQYTYTFAGWSPAVVAATGNATYTATYTSVVNKYTVTGTIDRGTVNGKASVNETVDYGTAYEMDFAPAAHYKISAVSVKVNGVSQDIGTFKDSEYHLSQEIIGNTVVEVTTTPITYNISYDLDGGSVSSANPTSYNVETATFTLNNPTKTGYTFKGWTGTGISGESMNVTIEKGSSGNRSYTATWTADTYTATFNANGGTVSPESKTFAIEQSLELPTPTRAGYNFTGWKVTQAEGNWESGKTYTGTSVDAGKHGDVTLTAQWNARTDTVYTVITYTENLDGTYTENSETRTGTTDTRATVTPFAPVGFEVNKSKSVLEGTITGDGKLVLMVYFDRKEYTVSLTEGTGIESVTGDGTYKYGESVTISATVKSGYEWVNWTGTAQSADQKYTFEMPAGDVSYTANAKAIEYSITYDLAGGKLPDGKTNPTGYNVETPTFTLNNPTKTGYTFAGWTGSNGSTAQTSVSIDQGSTGNKSYTATWTADTYTATFNANGGTVSPDSRTFTIEQSLKLPTPTRAGYNFTGWKVAEAEGNWNNGESYTGTSVDAGKHGDVTLTAQWNARTDTVYTVITYTENLDGTYTENSETRTGTTDTKATVTPSAPDGFEVDKSKSVLEGTITGDGKLVLKVYYDRKEYTVSLTEGAGIASVTGAGTYKYGASVTISATVKDGYEWVNWTGTAERAEQEYAFEMPDSDVNYTANAKAIEYSITYDLAGGKLPDGKANPTGYNVETETFTLINPEKTGYTFAGWTGTDLSDKTVNVSIENGSTGNRSYTANWTAIEYAITYDLDGGAFENGETTQNYTIETDLTLLGTPAKTNYVFLGWKLMTDSADDNWTDVPDTDVDYTDKQRLGTGMYGDVTLKAQWELCTGHLKLEYSCGAPVIVTVGDITLVLSGSGEVQISDLTVGDYGVSAQSAVAGGSASVSDSTAKIYAGETTTVKITGSGSGANWYTGYDHKTNVYGGTN